jgi:hypothetical protein
MRNHRMPFLLLPDRVLNLKIEIVTKLAATCGLFATRRHHVRKAILRGFDNPRLLS